MTYSQRKWPHSSVGRTSHQYREVTGSNPVEVLNFFSAFFTKLHKLRSLRRSFLHSHFISAVRFTYDLVHISLTYHILQHEKSLTFPQISTDVKIKKQTNKQTKRNKQKTTTATSIICTRTVVVYLGQLEEHRPVPKQRDGGSNRSLVFQKLVYSYFEKGCGKKMCTQQSRMAIWDMNSTRFLTLWLSNLLSWLSFSTGKHMSVASRGILSIFFEKQLTQNHPQYLSGLSRALFPTTLLEIAVCGLCFVLCRSSHDRNLIFSFFFLQ